MNKLIIAALVVATAFTACKKGVTTKRLQGDWSMTSGSNNSVATSVYSYGNGTNTQTTTTTYTYNGTKETGTRVVANSNPNFVLDNSNTIVDNGYTMTVSFDKEKQTYTMVTTSSEVEKDSDLDNYYDNSTNKSYNFVEAANVGGIVTYNDVTIDRQITTTTTRTEKGYYSITGGSNDLDKNSQIVFTPSSSVDIVKASYKYFAPNSTTEKTNLFGEYYDFNNGTYSYATLKTTEDYTEKNTSSASTIGMIATVTDRESSMMTLNFNEDSNNSTTQNSNTNTYKTTSKFVIEKK